MKKSLQVDKIIHPIPSLGNKDIIENLISIFNEFRDEKLSKYIIKDSNGVHLGFRNYYEMYFDYEKGKDLFKEILNLPCRGYQFVLMPEYYEMVVHKDISYLRSRIGWQLYGNAPISFYKSEKNTYQPQFEYDYLTPALIDVSYLHNVKNGSQERLSFFINFEQGFRTIKKELLKLGIY